MNRGQEITDFGVFAVDVAEIIRDQNVKNYKPQLNNARRQSGKMNSQTRESAIAVVGNIFVGDWFSHIAGIPIVTYLKNAVCYYSKPADITINKNRVKELTTKIDVLSARQYAIRDKEPETADLIEEELINLREELGKMQNQTHNDVKTSKSEMAKRALQILSKNNPASQQFYNSLRTILSPETVKTEAEREQDKKNSWRDKQDRFGGQDRQDRFGGQDRQDRFGGQDRQDRFGGQDRQDRFGGQDRQDRGRQDRFSGQDRFGGQDRQNRFEVLNEQKDREHAAELVAQGKFIPPHLRKFVEEMKAKPVLEKQQISSGSKRDQTPKEEKLEIDEFPELGSDLKTNTSVVTNPVLSNPSNPWASKNKTALFEAPKVVTRNVPVQQVRSTRNVYVDLTKIVIPVKSLSSGIKKRPAFKSAWDDDDFDDFDNFNEYDQNSFSVPIPNAEYTNSSPQQPLLPYADDEGGYTQKEFDGFSDEW